MGLSRFSLYKEIKKMSIKSRLAFAMRCIELALEKENIFDDQLSKMISLIWDFTNDDKHTDLWYERTAGLISKDLFVPYFNHADYPDFTEEEISHLKVVIEKLPSYIVQMIDCAISIGICEMYAAADPTGATFDYLIDVVGFADENEIELPNFSTFLKSKFSECGGWGIAHPRDFYITG